MWGKKCALAELFHSKAILLFSMIFSRSDCRRQHLLYGSGRLLRGRCHDVGIGVQGEPCREGSQHPGHCFDVTPVLKNLGCKGVPQIVEAELC